MAKPFAVTAILFSAIQSALDNGQSLADYATGAVKYDRSLPTGTTTEAYIEAYGAYVSANAVNVSMTSLATLATKVPTTKAKKAIALAIACEAHNDTHPHAPMATVLNANGTYSAMLYCPPSKSKSKSGGKGSGGRMSAHVIATKGSKTDGYTYSREGSRAEGYTYSLNGNVVDNLAAALATLGLDTDTHTGTKLAKYYPNLVK